MNEKESIFAQGRMVTPPSASPCLENRVVRLISRVKLIFLIISFGVCLFIRCGLSSPAEVFRFVEAPQHGLQELFRARCSGFMLWLRFCQSQRVDLPDRDGAPVSALQGRTPNHQEAPCETGKSVGPCNRPTCGR